MPISDVDSYATGHFARVYEHIVAPACQQAGFTPLLASQVQNTNFIALDILRRIINADMVLCDLSSRNPNVLYELGIRQAFNRPVTLIKDTKTPRIFDIQGLRDVEYDESLRIDTVTSAVTNITTTLSNTYAASLTGTRDVNSLVQLLSIEPASVPSAERISGDTQLLLNAVQSLGDRLTDLEKRRSVNFFPAWAEETPRLLIVDSEKIGGVGKNWFSDWASHAPSSGAPFDKTGHPVQVDDSVIHPKHGEGKVVSFFGDRVKVEKDDNTTYTARGADLERRVSA